MFCGYISLKFSVIMIALLDITAGLISMIISSSLVYREVHVMINSVIFLLNVVAAMMAIFSIVSTIKMKIKWLRVYYYWKIAEMIILPCFTVMLLV